MRAVIQRSYNPATIEVNNKEVARIQKGLIVYLGIEEEDSDTEYDWLSRKIINMRIFNDEEGKMNLSVLDIAGELLIISQFTLFASTRKGNRPSFIRSAVPKKAKLLYDGFCRYIAKNYAIKTETGIFGADMKVKYINDGPVTILIDTKTKE